SLVAKVLAHRRQAHADDHRAGPQRAGQRREHQTEHDEHASAAASVPAVDSHGLPYEAEKEQADGDIDRSRNPDQYRHVVAPSVTVATCSHTRYAFPFTISGVRYKR